jgi:uncharacterized protein (DUF305 family)
VAEALRRRTALVAVLAVIALAVAFLVGRQSHDPAAHSDPRPSAADIGFSQDMATHHEQAVLMATLAIDRARTAVRGLAEAILTGQSQEIGLFRGWLRLWGEPGVAPHPMAWMGHSMAGMPGMSGTDASSSMPGMATPAQLDHLYRLHGRAFDVLFLRLMIRHHQGGLLMTKAVLGDRILPTTRQAAQAVSAEQIEDLGTMRALLAADGGKPLPAPS